ncbi:ABC transporter permease [Dactylosporangium roseum]|uniref:ABC transporter permease n=1 Tax=Dactylosporangium roseum TaxID=47989 RepID=A0ABY5ZE90_9ACTN|nr:ABC transporter permease [Dactylosporangium roseum]
MTLLRLGLAGTRVDGVRVSLTALSSAFGALAVLAALNVLAIGRRVPAGVLAEQYSNAVLREPGLRSGVVTTLMLVTIPVFALAGQCVRLGAPARDRRLAAIRLAGATPRQAVTVASAETAVAGLLGSLAGLAGYLVGHALLHRPDATGRLPLPTDIFPPAWQMVAGALAIPVVAAVAAAIAMRRVLISPLGVVRKARRERPPALWAGLVIMLGVACLAVVGPFMRLADQDKAKWITSTYPILMYAGAALTGLGIVLGTAWVSYTAGRVLHRFARRPATLLAARRLTADPWNGSRTLAVLLICVLFAAGTAWFRAWFETDGLAQRRYQELTNPGMPPSVDPFYLRTMDLVDVAVLAGIVLTSLGMLVAMGDSIVSRRRAYASLVATGVPRSVLARSILWQAVVPAVPAILAALAIGVGVVHGLRSEVSYGGFESSRCTGTETQCAANPMDESLWTSTRTPEVHLPIPIPWDDLARDGGLALAAVLLTVAIGLLFLRSSTDLDEIRTT